MDRSHRVIAALFALSASACTSPPPLGEALVVVDTDLGVPLFASELRLDLYDPDDGRWYESRTVPLPDPQDWPASFSIYDPDDQNAMSALVRLRAYPRGKLRDYRGERFVDRPGPEVPPGTVVLDVPPSENEEPRLWIDGVDRTPAREPEPRLAVDRLLLLRLEPGKRGRLSVVLRGDCVGTMADLLGRRSCRASEGELLPLEEPALDDDMTPPTMTMQGAFAPPSDCTVPARAPGVGAANESLYDEEVCVPGGPYIFGNADTFGVGDASGLPERMAVMSPFLMDRFEVTVARWRWALQQGFESPDATPVLNPDPLDDLADHTSQSLCTWSQFDRAAYPLNCVSWTAAQAFCEYFGGSLPTEAQWEYAAQVAARPRKSPYPWGSADPDCLRATFGRVATGQFVQLGGGQCTAVVQQYGPLRVDQPVDGMDYTPGLGIVGMGGSMGELLRDAFAPLSSACWARAPLHDPACLDDGSLLRSLRGGSWAQSSIFLNPGLRNGDTIEQPTGPTTETYHGFRCVRVGVAP